MKKKILKELLSTGLYLLFVLLLTWLLITFVVQRTEVDGSSMENSLYDGEQVLIEKVSRYFDGPERFDVVVFTKNHGTYTKTYIKRIIGLPGETVQIIGDTIFINGAELEESFGKDPMDSAGIAAEPVELGEGEYFVLGDNRLISLDSRDRSVGKVKKEELEGVVFLRVAPFSSFGTIE